MGVKITTTGHRDNAYIQEANIPTTLESGLTKVAFENFIENDIPIDGFVGAVEKRLAFLDKEVPVGFPGRDKGADEDGNPLGIKTWKEYARYKANETNALIIIGAVGENSCRTEEVKDDELRIWVNNFNISNILTKSEMSAKIAESYTAPVE